MPGTITWISSRSGVAVPPAVTCRMNCSSPKSQYCSRKLSGNCLSSQCRGKSRFGFRHHSCFGGLVPDYAFLIKHTGGLSVCFVEVSSGEESTTRFREKLLAYHLWSDTEATQQFLIELYRTHGASLPRPQFRLLCVMHSRLGQSDDARLLQLVDAAAGIDTDMRRRIWCTTAQLLGKSKDLAGPIWRRLGELEPAFDESVARRRRALRQKLMTANRHSLFPTEAAT